MMNEWRNKWKIEIADCKDGVGHKFQDPLSDCIAEADIEVALLEAENATLKQENERYEQGFVYTSENGRELLVRMWNDEPWIFYKHPDGQWVSLKKIALLTAEETNDD